MPSGGDTHPTPLILISVLNICASSSTAKTLYTHRPLHEKPRSPGSIKIIEVQVQYTNPFVLLLFKILRVVRRAIVQLVAVHVYILSLVATHFFLSFSFLHNLNYH